ncbi:MAG: sel1 repeat family protein [Chloroflexi bacterium]|nr:sel1 repeat family protein [Chloroflexota bacterium]
MYKGPLIFAAVGVLAVLCFAGYALHDVGSRGSPPVQAPIRDSGGDEAKVSPVPSPDAAKPGSPVPAVPLSEFEILRKKAEAGDGNAMTNLGVMYGDGRGVAKDEREAVSWYRKAAESGNAGAMHNLGLMYGQGRGLEKDEIEAYVWLSTASAFGCEGARKGRDWIEQRLTAEARLKAQERSRVLFEQISRRVRK